MRFVFGAALALAAGGALAQTSAAPAPAAPASVASEPPALPQPLDCTFEKAFVCEAGKGCASVNALGELPLPSRMLVHFGKQILASTSKAGLPHISSIASVASAGDALVLQGVDGHTGWVMQASRSNPGVTFTVVDHDTVLTAFGACKPAP
ncbi:hypothetical protein G3545_08350 [Starkeya sp. ORNL1]|uniref:hypothetical protein n=1 Tax=Starkeya sp. ORNL1 TaxID=2709380 RepID=UPI0014646231|nr:hypothetical protein [Starkeya sp. ORNL1]QJP13664.1 hypothetical protein G3545_08350 [Starkeya sp. ORNL1]